MRRRQDKIREKGFGFMSRQPEIHAPLDPMDFAKIRVGLQTLDDAILDLGSLKKNNRTYGDKSAVLRAMGQKDYTTLREMSNYYYEVSGIYERLCKYFAFLYRYDWYVVPYVEDDSIK